MALPPYKAVFSSEGSSNPTMEMMIPEIKTPPAPISLCTNELTVPSSPSSLRPVRSCTCSTISMPMEPMNTNPSAPSEDMVQVCTSRIHHRRSDPFSGDKFVPYDRSSSRKKTGSGPTVTVIMKILTAMCFLLRPRAMKGASATVAITDSAVKNANGAICSGFHCHKYSL